MTRNTNLGEEDDVKHDVKHDVKIPNSKEDSKL